MSRRLLGAFVATILVMPIMIATGIVLTQEPPPSQETLQSAFPVQRQFSPYAGRNSLFQWSREFAPLELEI